MADVFTLAGSWTTKPDGSVSGEPAIEAPLNELVALKTKMPTRYDLTGSQVKVVDFGGAASAHVVILRAVGGKVRARFTSADGSQQAVPVDPFFAMISLASPVTALDLYTVPSGVSVHVFVGEKS